MLLTTRGRYGARIMCELARSHGNGPVSLKQIASSQGLSAGYLEHIIAPLRGAGLVYAERGARGGYALTKKPHEITMKEIVLSLEGPLNTVQCVDDPETCDHFNGCNLREVWQGLSDTIFNYLEGITLDQCCGD